MMIALVLALALSGQLSDAHRKWIEEEAVYIATDREKEVFGELRSVEERDRFIEAFWSRRDPNPATPRNEFREEHYRRIAYADEFLGRDTFRPGWRTDRGRYYILLGEPKTIERFSGRNEIVDSELWFYQGGDRGLTGAFFLLFFQRDGVGELELYHPIADGPTRLFRTAGLLPGQDDVAAVEKLEELSADLAHASLSYDAGLPPDYLTGRASLGSDDVLVRIEESPKRAVRTDYLDAWLKYGNRVAADYSFNYVPSRSAFGILVGPSNAALVHYSLELDPESFGFATDEDQKKFYTTLDVTLEARDPEGTLVLAHDRSDYVELTPSQVREIERYPIAYRDSFPLVPGRYTLSVVFRNRALKRYTVAETELSVPDFSQSAPALAGLLLGYRSAADLARLEPAADSVFAIGETVSASTQAVKVPEGARIRFDLLLDDESLDFREVPVDGVSGFALAELSTLGTSGGNYLVRARLTAPEGSVLAEAVAPLTLSPRTSLPRPNFVYRRGFNPAIPGLLPLVLGDQWWNLGKHDTALALYEKSVAAGNPDLPQARWKLAHAYLSRGHTSRALELLAPSRRRSRRSTRWSRGSASSTRGRRKTRKRLPTSRALSPFVLRTQPFSTPSESPTGSSAIGRRPRNSFSARSIWTRTSPRCGSCCRSLCYDVAIMMSRTQIAVDPELQRRARKRAAELGVSLAEYVRSLIARDLEVRERRADPSAIFDLGDSGGSDVARNKDRMIGAAIGNP